MSLQATLNHPDVTEAQISRNGIDIVHGRSYVCGSSTVTSPTWRTKERLRWTRSNETGGENPPDGPL